ncbi:protein phosphatase 2C domain-containing protein [Sphaerisporangium sp. TRM90804]|uniref:protein phosphatase 2C domain-containing protein n=1 Tax=Sphaerisporangium sp. TRM90804 TaxID=3031113 RepID=UPI0024489FC0|nr:protein phosphatase 2C domain-containing protein [Sphaerisporangium sp. TRM90804]MDH2426293.1 protein phosphatase 2C domain-containing protein [Sphaerisporangium sp. TRM90804]
MSACPVCGTRVLAGEAFCEQCGHDLAAPGPTPCTACGAARVGADGYCENCGMLQPTGRDHVEVELDGSAGASDRGRRHSRNEDAMALTAAGPGTVVGVVCDGVSTSPRPDEASQAAADVAAAAIAKRLAEGEGAEAATREGVRLAAAAVAAAARAGEDAPACTYVSAVVSARQVTVGWVGDSRAYWLGAQSALLTRDDATPGTHMLTAWLGADAGEVVPHVTTFTTDGPGIVLLCSDGLWNYYPEPEDLAAAAPQDAPLATARRLVRLANQAGGHDNITVVVIPFGQGDRADTTVAFPKERSD